MVNWLASGSYSNDAPSGNVTKYPSSDLDGAGLASQYMLGNTQPNERLPLGLKINTCSPTDGRHHVRLLPAR